MSSFSRSKQQSPEQSIAPPTSSEEVGVQDSLGNGGVQGMFDAAAGGPGDPLPFLSEMENAFGASFSGVTAHLGGGEAVSAMGAPGAARGDTVVFADAAPSKEMVAHELAHVLQARGVAGEPGPGGSSNPEVDADNAAAAAVAGLPVQIAARVSPSEVHLWNSHEHMAFGNLGAIKATGGTMEIGSRDTSIDDEDGLLADINRRGEDALMVQTNDSVLMTPEGVPITIENEISFGDASELGGDYTRNPEELANRESGDTGAGPLDFLRMVTIAQSNVNHFYPLHGQEYARHHAMAVGAARTGDRRTAMVEEGFAAHFLQDTFAAGHMAPRALDRVGAEGESDLGLNRSKIWHDALNAETAGLPTSRGRFRGDDTMNGADLDTISSDVAASLGEVIALLEGRPAQPFNFSMPIPNHSQIIADADYGPIWTRMMGDYEADLRVGEREGSDLDQTTDGGTDYSTGDTARDIRANVFGGESAAVMRLTNTAWNGETLVFNMTADGQPAPVNSEIWVKWFDCDMGYDRGTSGRFAGEATSPNATPLQDTDELLSGPTRVRMEAPGVGAARSGHDDTGDTYAVFFADRECTQPIGRSMVQGTNTGGDVETPLTVSGFGWSGNRLSFSVRADGQPANDETVYLRWFNNDSGWDADSDGYKAQTIADTDDQVGGTYDISVSDGRGGKTATGKADNSNDTYAIIYLDENCNIPLGRSELQP